MQIIEDFLAHKNPKFKCKDTSKTKELIVDLTNSVGKPADAEALRELSEISGPEARHLSLLYKKYDGLQFHVSNGTAGLVIASVSELEELNSEWKEWFAAFDEDDLYEFQKHGVAFGTIDLSGNYFVIYEGKVFYSDHDGGDDAVWGETLEDFFKKALLNPAKFLYDAGCYTRYSKAGSNGQYIPEEYIHD